jgi:hypothetical protein
MGADFPYRLRTMCYIEIDHDGSVSWGHDPSAYERARAGRSRLFAVWPGEWASHLFVIDDLDQYARGMGLVHDVARTGLAEHEHQVRWAISPYEPNPDASYISIDVWLDCGCEVRDLRAFAEQMREQKGWVIATTGGLSSGAGTFSLRARRKSLTR